jgi:adenosylcobinamide-phosphate synthase
VLPAPHAAAVVLLAVTADLLFGDPPNRLHPVAWMGGALAAGRAGLCRGSPRVLVVAGGALTVAVMALAAVGGVAVVGLADALGPGGVLLEAAALKSTLALRDLAGAARAVARALSAGDLAAARERLGLHLVSRPTTELDAAQVASGAIESVAENLTDSFAAPLLFYAVFGLPGALAYRALNTADTMLGYREGLLEHFGKAAARLDDVANLVPARLAALVIVLVAGRGAGAAWSTMCAHHARTASPNAGWTMSAAAGALELTLAKPGAYRLGHGRPPGPPDVDRAIRLISRAAALLVVAATAVILTW